jgi:hypothetical protein
MRSCPKLPTMGAFNKMGNFRLILRPLPRPGDENGIRRLRAIVKMLLRSYGMRIVEACEVKDEQLDNLNTIKEGNDEQQ